MLAPPKAQLKDDGEDFHTGWSAVWAHPWLVFNCIVIALLAGGAYLTFTPSKFEAVALISIDPRTDTSFARRASTSDANSDFAVVETEAEILRSAAVARQVVVANNLADDEKFGGSRGFRAIAGATIQRLIPASRDYFPSPAQTQAARVQRAVDALMKTIKIKRISTTYVVTVSAEMSTAEGAARIANEYAKVYVASRLAALRTSAQQSSDLLNERAKNLQQRLLEAETAVENKRVAVAAEGADAIAAKVALRNLEGTARNYRTLYDKLLENYAEANEASHIAVPRAQIVSEATEASTKQWPNATLVLAGSLVIGLGVGCIVALIRGNKRYSS